MADEIVKIVVTHGFILEMGKTTKPGDILDLPKKVANGFISASQAAIATPAAIQEVKAKLAADEAERQRQRVQDQRAREAFLALARPATVGAK